MKALQPLFFPLLIKDLVPPTRNIFVKNVANWASQPSSPSLPLSLSTRPILGTTLPGSGGANPSRVSPVALPRQTTGLCPFSSGPSVARKYYDRRHSRLYKPGSVHADNYGARELGGVRRGEAWTNSTGWEETRGILGNCGCTKSRTYPPTRLSSSRHVNKGILRHKRGLFIGSGLLPVCLGNSGTNYCLGTVTGKNSAAVFSRARCGRT